MNDILVDTNVLIYAKDKSSTYHDWAIKTISENNCFLTSKNLSEYYSVLTRGDDPFLSPADTLKDIIEFSNRFNILYPDPFSLQTLLLLTDKYHPKGLKFHDFEIAAIAITNKVERIATVNRSDFDGLEEIQLIFPDQKISRK